MNPSYFFRLILLLGLIFIQSCDNRNFLVSKSEESPEEESLEIELGPNGAGTKNDPSKKLIDSVKYGLKIKQHSKALPLSITDTKHKITNVSIKLDSGSSAKLASELDFGRGFPQDVTFEINSEGTSKFIITATNESGGSAQREYRIRAFGNLRPVAVLSVVQTSGADSVLVDASASYDADAKYGGAIQAYKYTIGGQELPPTRKNKRWYSFSSRGTFTIKLKVVDNDSEESEESKESVKEIVIQ